ncbi:hypothetical protein PtB15_14B333 [Puccinia triticina]|nr:hypothetical protein PtB15_14B333 [Puccinia triticina]
MHLASRQPLRQFPRHPPASPSNQVDTTTYQSYGTQNNIDFISFLICDTLDRALFLIVLSRFLMKMLP